MDGGSAASQARPVGDVWPVMYRVAFVLSTVGLAGAAFAAFGFGAKSVCTSGPPSNSSACDAIDHWAWGGMLAVAGSALVGASFSSRPGVIRVTVAFIACAVVLTCVGMSAVDP